MSIIPHRGSFVKAFYKKNKKIFFARLFEQAQDFISEQMFAKRWQGSAFEQMFDGAPKIFLSEFEVLTKNEFEQMFD